MSTSDLQLDAMDAWVVHAKWHVGEISDDEYADYLEAREDEDEMPPATQILLDELRKREK